MHNLHSDLAYAYAKRRLQHELPAHCRFHTMARITEQVLPALEQLAESQDVADCELQLLRTAAWFLDLGMIERTANYQLASVRIAVEVLSCFGYQADHIEHIAGIILATRLPQTPRNTLEAILADANCAWFGTPTMLEQGIRWWHELLGAGVTLSRTAWYEQLRRMLRNHRYHTSAAQALYDPQRQRNCAQLEQWIVAAEWAPAAPRIPPPTRHTAAPTLGTTRAGALL